MTRTYHDAETVTRLLEEKETDLELAAHIGQSLLTQNKDLLERVEELEHEAHDANEQLKQLIHELNQKGALLHFYAQEASDESSSSANVSPESRRLSGYQLFAATQARLRVLQDDNIRLQLEATELRSETVACEKQEQKLTTKCVQELLEAQKRIHQLQVELDRKTTEYFCCQDECSALVRQLGGSQQKTKQLTMENFELQEYLRIAQNIQRELSTEIYDVSEKYAECDCLLAFTRKESKLLQQKLDPRVYVASICHQQVKMCVASTMAEDIGGHSSHDYVDSISFSDRQRYQRVLDAGQVLRSRCMPALHTSCNKPSSGAVTSCQLRQGARNIHPLLAVPIPGSDRHAMAATTVSSEKQWAMVNSGKDKLAAINADSTVSQQPAKEHGSSCDSVVTFTGSMGDTTSCVSSCTPLVEEEEESACRTSAECPFANSIGSSAFFYRMPAEKLQIIKPLEGSLMLHQWQQLATPLPLHIAAAPLRCECTSGGVVVLTKLTEPLLPLLHTASPGRMQDEGCHLAPYKDCEKSCSTYTYTTSKIMNPTDEYRKVVAVQKVVALAASHSVKNLSQNWDSLNKLAGGRNQAARLIERRQAGAETRTFSVSLNLATLLKERGIMAAGASVNCVTSPTRVASVVTDSCHSANTGAKSENCLSISVSAQSHE